MTTIDDVNNIATTSVTNSVSRRMAHGVAGSLLLVLVAGMAGCKQRHNADVVATVNGHAIKRTEMD